ncbi:MAG: hypothetical protein LLG15_05350 [Betaproteobacteria bacterium]|nr:hypothetical protein [Betaproteobacteria bacterium]
MTLPRLIFAVIAIWIVAAVTVWLTLPDWASRGQFGDLFGSVNALFSGLAFAGLYSALRLQQEQLALQRTELVLQREELKLQREEMAASRAELANQVAAQKALFRASVAQIAVAATQAKIEAVKMESERYQPQARDYHIKKIEALADALSSLSDRVEGEA